MQKMGVVFVMSQLAAGRPKKEIQAALKVIGDKNKKVNKEDFVREYKMSVQNAEDDISKIARVSKDQEYTESAGIFDKYSIVVLNSLIDKKNASLQKVLKQVFKLLDTVICT